jgi:hypothetical protein
MYLNNAFHAFLPFLSTIGRADTLYSANVFKAVITGVCGLIY